MYGMLEGTDPCITPMRRALALWGLTADDIGVFSIHDTSTGANVGIMIFIHNVPNAHLTPQEENETRIWNNILTAISRTPGNLVPIMVQKSLLGHSKGGSASWQVMGVLQSVNTGLIPGKRRSE